MSVKLSVFEKVEKQLIKGRCGRCKMCCKKRGTRIIPPRKLEKLINYAENIAAMN